MNILNQPNSGLYSGVIAIWKALQFKGSLPEKELHSLVSPVTFFQDNCRDEYFKNTINAWVNLGFFKKDSKELISISKEYINKKDLKQLLFEILL